MTLTAPAPAPACLPRYATASDPSAPNLAPRARRIARALGIELLPWQHQALQLAGELDPATGRHRWPEIVLLVPRRAGKTTVALCELLRVATSGVRRRGWYTAHRREVGAALWRDEWMPMVEQSAMAQLVACRRSNGSEALTIARLGSTVRLFAPNGEALRSQNADSVVVDEAREFSLELGAALEAAVAPAQAIPKRRQRWVISNAGGAHSTWLAAKRSAAIEALEDGRPTRTALLEWSLPAELDPDDPASWPAAHPALGAQLELEALLEDRDLIGAERFRVEYLGLWPATAAGSPFALAWDDCGDADAAPADPVTLAVELDPSRCWAAIVAAGAMGPRVAVEVLERRPHGDWLLPRLAELVARHEPAAVVYDSAGPMSSDAPSLQQLRCNVVGARTRDVIASAGWFADAVVAGRMAHRHQEALTSSVLAADRKPAGGAWLFRRSDAAVIDAGPVIAASLAAWHHQHSLVSPSAF